MTSLFVVAFLALTGGVMSTSRDHDVNDTETVYPNVKTSHDQDDNATETVYPDMMTSHDQDVIVTATVYPDVMTSHGQDVNSTEIVSTDVKNANVSQVNQLLKTLLKDYNKDTLPTNHLTEQFKINVSTLLLAIGDLDEIEEKLSSVLGFLYRWRDESIVWDSNDHNGITNLTIDSSLMWKPVFKIINTHHSTKKVSRATQENKIVYNEKGFAMWSQLIVLDTTCDLDTSFYPFDVQVCELKLSLPDYIAFFIEVDVIDSDKHLFHFNNNGAWWLVHYNVTGSKHSNLNIIYVLRRKPMFVIVNVLLPIVVLAFLTPLVFLLPKDSGERVNYTVTVLLSISVYMTILSDNLPANSDPMPLLSVLLLIFYVLSAFIVLMVIVNFKVFKAKDRRPVPLLAKKFVLLMGCASLCRRRNQSVTETTVDFEERETCLETNDNTTEGGITHDESYRPDIRWSCVSNAVDWLCFYFTFTVEISLFVMFFVKSSMHHSHL